MTKGTHEDEEPTRWTSIGWQALLIANRLRCQAQLHPDEKHHEQRQRESERATADEQREKTQREYVEKRLADLAAFERRVSGNKN
jgi:hypothetical protein